MATIFTTPKKHLTFLITGCSSGFGLSLAGLAQAGGHTVIATSRNPSKTPELVEEFQIKGGKWIQLDVDSPDSSKVIEELESSGQEIEYFTFLQTLMICFNNAGFSIFATVETSTEEEIRSQMETMYFGPLRLIKAVLPYMRQRRFGIIVNMSSGASLSGAPTMGPYAGAKAGLDGMTKVLAKEVAAYNIRTLTVVLGTFNTSLGLNAIFGKIPLPEDYKGTMAENMITWLKSGKVPINGDKDKAMKAVYDVVVGQGIGSGKEAEQLLLLGSDMVPRAKLVQDTFAHSLEVFGSFTNGVNIDK
ncbi:putative oxidoreductase [Lachnellula subtilissima]|uniref:Putative oxidoreductase n=1 Tax=Lachnellula subtilissima TaxID=602034 RepID=A0A8H8U790_9HELO|nr:putative oxidoreductase [Lachnellula subtilissima]